MLKKIAVAALATIMVVAVQTTNACDTAQKASATQTKTCTQATQASAGCSATCTAHAMAKSCTRAEAAACGAKKGYTNASAQYLCSKGRSEFAKLAPFGFLKNANVEEVHVAVEETEDGFALVFTGVNENNVDQALQLANQTMEALAAPASCEVTRASMVKEANGCKETEACLHALANCNVAVVQIEGGAKTVVTTPKADQVKELHGVLASVGVAPKAEADSE